MSDYCLQAITRRHFFKHAGFGIGGAALASLMQEQLFAQAAHGRWRPGSRRRPNR